MATDNTNLFHKEGVVIGGLNRADNTFHIASVDANGQINVNATFSGSISGNAAASATGSAVPVAADYQGINIAGNLVGQTGFALIDAKAAAVAIVDGNGDQITSFGGGTQFADNVASGATPTGTLAMGWDSVNSKIRALKVDASQDLLVAFAAAQHAIIDSGSITVSGTVGVSGNVTVVQGTAANLNATVIFGAPQHVIVDSGPAVDVTDRAVRLLGVIYGSQGQQLKQTATNFNAAVELATGGTLYDARQTRALTAADIVTINNASLSVTQGTTPWTIQGDSASGAAKAGNPVQTGGVFNTTQPTVTSGQTVEAQSTARGARIVATGIDTFAVAVNAINASLPTGSNNIGFVRILGAGGTALDGTVGAGPAPTNMVVVGAQYNASPPAPTSGQTMALQTDSAGNLKIVGGGGGTQFADNSASGATPTGTLSMGWDSVNSLIRALKVDTSQNLLVSDTGLKLAADSTTAGQLGPLIFGAVTSVAPSYNTGRTDPLSIDTNGNLRTLSSILGKQSGPFSFAWTSATAQDSVNPDSSITGYGTVIVTLNQGTTITGGAVTFEVSEDGATWYSISGVALNNLQSAFSTYTLQDSVNKALYFNVAGWAQFRVRLSTVISGTGTVNVGIVQNSLPAAYGQPTTFDSFGNVTTNVQALVSDSPETYLDGVSKALSLTGEGRLRVAATIADIDRIWNNTFPLNLYGLATQEGETIQNSWENFGYSHSGW